HHLRVDRHLPGSGARRGCVVPAHEAVQRRLVRRRARRRAVVRPPVDVAAPPAPIQEAVGEFVAALVDRPAAATNVQPTPIDRDPDEREQRWVVALYEDQQGRLAALALADLAFAAATGAALGMIPAAAASDAVKAGELSETLAENYAEVANI